MNQFKITVYISTTSENPTSWLTESIIDNLEEGEELTSITTVRYENNDQKS
jgi:hypothetical protein|tara:strand:+ start:582 stop:734 length:153 start_codon:yes stop_codon:yes gene_type:complete